MAHFRIIRSYMCAVAKADADGRYEVEVAPLADGQVQFPPSLLLSVWVHPYLSTLRRLSISGCSALESGIQSQLFTMTTLDANRELTILALG